MGYHTACCGDQGTTHETTEKGNPCSNSLQIQRTHFTIVQLFKHRILQYVEMTFIKYSWLPHFLKNKWPVTRVLRWMFTYHICKMTCSHVYLWDPVYLSKWCNTFRDTWHCIEIFVFLCIGKTKTRKNISLSRSWTFTTKTIILASN